MIDVILMKTTPRILMNMTNRRFLKHWDLFQLFTRVLSKCNVSELRKVGDVYFVLYDSKERLLILLFFLEKVTTKKIHC